MTSLSVQDNDQPFGPGNAPLRHVLDPLLVFSLFEAIGRTARSNSRL
jgi:hypothetical protein